MREPIDLTIKYKPCEGVLFKRIDDEAVLLDSNSGQYFGLNEIGSKFWASLSDGEKINAIVDSLLSEYEVEREELLADIDALMQQLLEHKLLDVQQD